MNVFEVACRENGDIVDGCDMMIREALIAQWIEHRSSKPVVAGSNPAGRANPPQAAPETKKDPKVALQKALLSGLFPQFRVSEQPVSDNKTSF